MLNEEKIKELKKFAINIRIESMKAFGNLGFGHVGGSFSIADTLAVLYGDVMKVDPKNPKSEDRDWLISSKGHAGPAIYAALALKGYFPLEVLMTLNKPGTRLPSHCDKNLTVGVDMTTGSLGQGSSLAVGVALGHKLDRRNNYTYLILGDGELQEGQIWEAASYAAHAGLDNLIAFVDYNKKQLDGFLVDINKPFSISGKFTSFGWHAQDIDGHNVESIYNAIEEAKRIKGKPSVIVLDTIKGKGWKYCETAASNHHVTVSKEQMEEAIEELKKQLEEVMI
ncbi:transketolase [Paratissierella segnis]|uniref:Transketolase n=1 Tax=Paratissierella segnis TaxID=2763679 RepID=A0A926EVH8_9FIRM|nr:transketolase [Paratissierella segnis]MBC8587224.1 transketolase [Paratissierella segnis]